MNNNNSRTDLVYRRRWISPLVEKAAEAYPVVIITGARQVGKTYIVERFIEKHFQNCVTINFDLQPEMIPRFANLDPIEIVNNIFLATGQKIVP